MEPKVTLISWTRLPLETLYSIWWASKTNNQLITPEQVAQGARDPDDHMGSGGLIDLFRKVVAQKIPVSESIYFTFMMEGVSVSWREQAVRHRIGHKHDDRIGMDIVPNQADSSWWSQSMRILSMEHFADDGAYRVADTIKALQHSNPILHNAYHIAMREIQKLYKDLVDAGVPMEDARDLMPLGAQHRISWTMNINSMLHIIGKRSCWILQLGLWGPIIQGIVSETATKVHPVFYEMASPPCMEGDTYNGCHFIHENERRVSGEDNMPMCPLFQHYELYQQRPPVETYRSFTTQRHEDYQSFWGRDVWTGKRINNNETK